MFVFISQMPILETPRLILRPFREEDIDHLAELTANPDFMRFTLGPYTREQTQGVLDKFLSWDKAGLPSPFTHSPRKHSITSRGGEKWNENREGNHVSGFSDAGVCDDSGAVAGGAWRWMNSRPSARYAWAAGPLEAYSRIDFPKLGASLKRTLRGITVS